MSARSERRFRVRRGDRALNLAAVTLDDEELFYGSHHRARRICAFLNWWQPDDIDLNRFLQWNSPESREYVKTLRRITLRYPATCERCGQPIEVGARATWDPSTKAVLHGARCPLRVEEAA